MFQLRSRDNAAAPTAPEINPAISAPLGRIYATPHFTDTEPGKEYLAYFGFAIAVAIGQKKDIRGAGDDDAPASGHNAVCGRQVGGPNFGNIHPAIPVGVLEHFHHSIRTRHGGPFEALIRLDTSYLGIKLAGLVEFLDVEVALQIVAV